jgi:hypothetical protein
MGRSQMNHCKCGNNYFKTTKTVNFDLGVTLKDGSIVDDESWSESNHQPDDSYFSFQCPLCKRTYEYKEILQKETTELLVVVVRHSVIHKIYPCQAVNEQEGMFWYCVLEESGFEPEDCDYENGFADCGRHGSVCMTSITRKL